MNTQPELHHYPKYPKDFWGDDDVQTLSPTAKLVHNALLDFAWQSGAMSEKKVRGIIANTFGQDPELWEEIRELWEETEAGWVQRRMEQEREIATAKIERARENGKRGGRPPKKPRGGRPEEAPQPEREQGAAEADEIPAGLGGKAKATGPRPIRAAIPSERECRAAAKAHAELGHIQGVEDAVAAWRAALEDAGKLHLWRSLQTFRAHLEQLAAIPEHALEAIQWAEVKAHADPEEAIRKTKRTHAAHDRTKRTPSDLRTDGTRAGEYAEPEGKPGWSVA